MWENRRKSISAGNESINIIADGNVDIHLDRNIPTELVDEAIEKEVDKLRKSRFFFEFDSTRSSLRLARRIIDGNLSGGSDERRGRALAWCARVLSSTTELEEAAAFLEAAKLLGESLETRIADAFITSQQKGKTAALQALAEIDTCASHSARLMVVAHHDGIERAIDWLNNTGRTSDHLDSDGKSFLLTHQLQLGHWQQAAETCDGLTDPDFVTTPCLHHLAALTALASAVPAEFRAVVITQTPFDCRGFPLSSDSDGMSSRRTAHKHFLKAVEVAEQLDCIRAAKADDEYALWLELRDPTQTMHGKSRLENKLRDRETALGFVHYALQFGIELDLSAVERDIERSIAINGGMTIDAALARFALAFIQPTPEEAANYIGRHHDQLAAHLDVKLMHYRQIEMLSRAGLIERANDILKKLREAGIPTEHDSNLQRMISEAQGCDPVESRKAQYEATKTLQDLMNLVAELEDHQHWNDLCHHGKLLFDQTRSLADAERLTNAFNNAHRSDALVDFINCNQDLLPQSKHLRMSYAWGLYHEGALRESLVALDDLSDEPDNKNYRALQVNLGICTGDWASLTAYIANEHQRKDDRSAQELIGAAQLALHLESPHTKGLVFEAAAKADNNPAILAAAYFIATSGGWEDEPEVSQWLENAARMSGEGGPLQKMSLREILDRKPAWDHRESETWRSLSQGKMPIFLGAESLNKTLINLTTFPALANLKETDPRRRSAIPAYSGTRVPLSFDISGKVCTIDATALLTLSFLKILDLTLDLFEVVHIPHSTLSWLFTERQKTSFHQPSQVANAREVRDLIATDMLEKFAPSTTANSEVSAQVGDQLAALIAEAARAREGVDTQHIVVRSAPVHRLSSLMEEEADLSAHAAVLCSCLALVEKLRQKAVITAVEEKRARAFLLLHERPWPNQPEIADGATLYLDDLTISYLLHLGLLGKLKAAGLTAVASQKEVSEADALISYDRIAEEAKGVIERIRASLSSRITSGKVRVSRRRRFDESAANSISEHPTADVFALASECHLAIIDDRFINKHANIESDNSRAPILTTLDILDGLVAAGTLSVDDHLDHRTRLRRAGYSFIPVTAHELERCLRESAVVDGEVVETAELKAIRESVLHARMSDWLQLPEEAPWLDGVLRSFSFALRSLWVKGDNPDEITARSNWIIEQLDIRGWAHTLVPEKGENVVLIGRSAHILSFFAPLIGAQQGVTDDYFCWIEGIILTPLQEQFPEVYEWLVDWYRNHISTIVETELPGEISS